MQPPNQTSQTTLLQVYKSEDMYQQVKVVYFQ